MNCAFEQETMPSLMGTSVKRSPFLNFKHGRHSHHALSWVALTEVVRKIEKRFEKWRQQSYKKSPNKLGLYSDLVRIKQMNSSLFVCGSAKNRSYITYVKCGRLEASTGVLEETRQQKVFAH